MSLSREIKFRIWDNDIKIMQAKVSLNSLCVNNYFEETQGDKRWMQYTGLKDKNGKEIYEGDIVSTRQFQRHLVKDILYVNGCFIVKDIDKILPLYWLIGEYSVSDGYVEVIGNIYENPELLPDGEKK